MKVVWLFPPMGKGFPNVSQYRFYKRMPIRASIIYPYLAASGCTLIRDHGHEIHFMDCPTEEKTWGNVEPEVQDADLVILEGRTPIIQQIWDAIWVLKEMNPAVKVAVYGDHVSWNPQETLQKGADYIIQGGDFDRGASKLCATLEAKKAPASILNYGLQEDLDTLPYVDRELVNWRNYYEAWKARKVFLWNMSQRGCYYQCVYCAWVETFWQSKLRQRSPELVAQETQQLFNTYGELEILDDADLFDMHWGAKFAKLLLERDLGDKKILWSCQTHPAMITNLEDLKLMKQSGLHVVKLGIESGSEESLKRMKKGCSRAVAERAIKLLQEAHVIVHANMMIGFPWESRSDVEEWLSWIKQLDPNQAQFSLVIPYPNTELWRMAQENEWFIQDPSDWSLYDASYPMLKMEGLSGEEIVDLYRHCWSSFYLNRKYIWRHIKTVRHWEGLRHLLRGFRSIYFGHMRAVGRKEKD